MSFLVETAKGLKGKPGGIGTSAQMDEMDEEEDGGVKRDNVERAQIKWLDYEVNRYYKVNISSRVYEMVISCRFYAEFHSEFHEK